MKNILIVGDSHAAHLIWGLSFSYPDSNVLQATATGCRPYIGSYGVKKCIDLVNYTFNDFLPLKK